MSNMIKFGSMYRIYPGTMMVINEGTAAGKMVIVSYFSESYMGVIESKDALRYHNGITNLKQDFGR